MLCSQWLGNVFSDKKLFVVEAAHHAQNHCILVKDIADESVNERLMCQKQKPASGVDCVWWEEEPLIFILEEVKVNAAIYINILKSQVLPWLQAVYPDGKYTFQQDRALSHTARKTQASCQKQFSGFWDKNIWPPSSPDIDPMA